MGVLVKKGECEQTDNWGINELCERMSAELSSCPGKEGEARVTQHRPEQQATDRDCPQVYLADGRPWIKFCGISSCQPSRMRRQRAGI